MQLNEGHRLSPVPRSDAWPYVPKVLIRILTNSLQQRTHNQRLKQDKRLSISHLAGGCQGRWVSLLHDLVQVDHLPGWKHRLVKAALKSCIKGTHMTGGCQFPLIRGSQYLTYCNQILANPLPGTCCALHIIRTQ